MKAAVILCISIGLCATAQQKPAAPAKAAPVKPTTIPAGAEEIGLGSYRYTDASGVHWLLRKTPFGVAAVEEKNADFVKASDAGDKVRFVRNSPFGANTWERKKSELTESEREVWERQCGHEEPR
jgi:hypothetical protein